MDFNAYQQLALRTAPGVEPGGEESLKMGAMGLAGEAGEVVDELKKVFYQGKELNKEVLVAELGDVLWYVAILAQGLGVELETVAAGNIEKLQKRYPQGVDWEV